MTAWDELAEGMNRLGFTNPDGGPVTAEHLEATMSLGPPLAWIELEERAHEATRPRNRAERRHGR